MESKDGRKNVNDADGPRSPSPVAIHRAEGATPAEQYLRGLAERSFLRLWTYPSPYKEPGKELCDLLVVFGDHILIFSDKACQFPASGSLALDWNRWYRAAIQKAVRQLWGAASWIKQNPNHIFLHPKGTQPFPLRLPNPAQAKMHYIIVAHGASARCKQELGGSGSLLLDPTLTGSDKPFTIGQLDPARGFVHVFDDISLPIIMNTLDTITDFVSYLMKKEAFITSGGLRFAAREEDLLAYYLAGPFNQQGERDFVNLPEADALEGLWAKFDASSARHTQQLADRVSYEWDTLIEYFNEHALAGTAYYASSPEVNDHARILSFMAQEPRLRRRILAEALGTVIGTTPEHSVATGTVCPKQKGDPHYVFLVHRGQRYRDEDEYRARRRAMLSERCMVTKLEHPDAQDIIGLAIYVGPGGLSPEDVAYLDGRQWNAARQQEAERIRPRLQSSSIKILPAVTIRELEYPGIQLAAPDPVKSAVRSKRHPVPKKANRLPRSQRKK